MKKKKINNMLNTIPLKDIFSDKVYFDLENGVIYDKGSCFAIGYMKALTDSVAITVHLPDLLDEDCTVVKQNVLIFFSNNVFKHITNDLYYHADGGFIKIGETKGDTGADLKIPRVHFDRDDEPIDEVDIEADPDPDDMEPDLDPQEIEDMISKLIS